MSNEDRHVTKNFLLLAYDHKDEGAYDRRMQVRSQHIALIDDLREHGQAIVGAAILDEQEKMVGSTIFFSLSKAELEEYLDKEPYVTNNVWDKIIIQECKIGPSFLK